MESDKYICFVDASMTGRFAYALFLASLVLFGTNGVVAGMIDLGSDQIVLLRTLLASVLIVPVTLLAGRRFRMGGDRRQALYVVLSGLSMGGSWILLYESYDLVGVGIASMLYYCGPVIVMALSPVLFGERFTARRVIGFAVVAVGAVMLCAEAVGSGGNVLGYVLGLGSAVLHALMVIFSKKAHRVDGLENTSVQLAFSFLAAAVFCVLAGDLPSGMTSSDWLWALVLGFANTGLGCLLYFSTITRLEAQTVAISGYLEPLSSVVFAAMLLGEHMTAMQLAGVLLILLGALYAETRGRRPATG